MSAKAEHYDVIRKPVITEKSTLASEANGVVFEVAIDAKGRFYVNGRQLLNTQAKTLRQALQAAAGENDSPPVIISADAMTPHQAVVQIMDAARELGFVRLTFATRLVPESNQ